MKIGRLPTVITFLTILILTACQDEPQPLAQNTFTPSPTYTPRPSPAQLPTPSPTLNQPINQSTNTPIPTPTPIPTTRVRPTSTPRPTTTLTPFPDILLTPATPPSATGYSLKPWTAEDADNLGRLMEAYHESMGSHYTTSLLEQSWNYTAEPAAIAYREAQLRFPDNPRLQYWQLGEAVNFAISDNSESITLFQSLLENALNSGQAELSESSLYNWLTQYPSQFFIQIQGFPASTGNPRNYVIAITSNYWVGGVTYWIPEENGVYTVHFLHDNLGDPYSSVYYFDSGLYLDPQLPHIAIGFGRHNGTSVSDNHIIFNLDEFPPTILDFGPERPWQFGYRNSLDITLGNKGQEVITIQSEHLASCDLLLNTEFEWNGQWFELVKAESTFQATENVGACLISWLDISNYPPLSEIERVAILEAYEEEFNDVQPRGIDVRNVDIYTEDAQDEFRFYLALNHAILGHVEQAKAYLQLIVDSPSIEESRWIEPAEIFLSEYDSADSLYPTCLKSSLDICPYQKAFIASVSNLPPMDWSLLRNQVIDWGTAIAANGSFDFDNDGETEHWLVLRHQPSDPLELFVFSKLDEGWQAVYAGEIATIPVTFQLETIDPTRLTRPLYFDYTAISINNDTMFSFFRHPVHQTLYVRQLYYKPNPPTSDPLNEQYNAILDRFWNGTDSAEIATDLLNIAANPDFRPDAEYYYYLGLVYELMGEEEFAVIYYMRTWQEHCCFSVDYEPIIQPFTAANPYAIMAQAKLIPE